MIFSNVVGIDGGINFIAATYDSKRKSTFVNGRAVKQKRAHYKKLRQQLQKVQTPSSRRRLKAIGNRENRWMHDVKVSLTRILRFRVGPVGALWLSLQDYLLLALTFLAFYSA